MDRPTGPAVVLTRQHEDNQELAAALTARGVVVREIPCLATRYLPLKESIIKNPDAVVFTSRRGVRGFFQQKTTSLLPSPILGEGGAERRVRGETLNTLIQEILSLALLGKNLFAFSREREKGLNDRAPAGDPLLGVSQRVLIAAVGQATAREIQSYDVPVDLIADPPEGAVLANLLKNALPVGSRLLLVRGNLKASEIDSILTKAGYQLEDLVAYENIDLSVATLQPFPVAAVFIASPSAAKRLLSANPWVKDKRMLTIGKTTALALKELGSTRVEEIGADPRQWIEVLFHAYQEAANSME